jgi:cell division protein FtsN
MDEIDDITFEQTVDWATSIQERKEIKKGVNILYLILAAFVILSLVVLIIYLVSRDADKIEALEMMKNQKYSNRLKPPVNSEAINTTETINDYEEIDPTASYEPGYEYIEEYVEEK